MRPTWWLQCPTCGYRALPNGLGPKGYLSGSNALPPSTW